MILAQPNELAPAVSSDRLCILRASGLMQRVGLPHFRDRVPSSSRYQIGNIVNNSGSYRAIVRDGVYHRKLESLGCDVLLAFISRSLAQESNWYGSQKKKSDLFHMWQLPLGCPFPAVS